MGISSFLGSMLRIIDINLTRIVYDLTADLLSHQFAKSTINWGIKLCKEYFSIKLADFEWLEI